MILHAEKMKRGPTGEWAAENLAYLLTKASHTGVTMPLVVATLHTVALRCPFHRRTLANLGVGVVVEGVLADMYEPNRTGFCENFVVTILGHSITAFLIPCPKKRHPRIIQPPPDGGAHKPLSAPVARFFRRLTLRVPFIVDSLALSLSSIRFCLQERPSGVACDVCGVGTGASGSAPSRATARGLRRAE